MTYETIDWSRVTGISEATRQQGMRLASPARKAAPTGGGWITHAGLFSALQPGEVAYLKCDTGTLARLGLDQIRKSASVAHLVAWLSKRLRVTPPSWSWMARLYHDIPLIDEHAKYYRRDPADDLILRDCEVWGTYWPSRKSVTLNMDADGGMLVEAVCHEVAHHVFGPDESTADAFGKACRAALAVYGRDDSDALVWIDGSGSREPSDSTLAFAKRGDVILTQADTDGGIRWTFNGSSAQFPEWFKFSPEALL